MTAGRRGRIAAATIAAVLAIVWAANWWFSDERAVRRQLATIAQALTVTRGERELAAVRRVGTLRNVLAPDITVAAGSQQIASRDAVVALVARWIPPPGGIAVEFDDVQVTVAAGRTAAQVYCTAKVTGRSAGGEPTVDARELTVGFTKRDGAWIVNSVRTEETLTR